MAQQQEFLINIMEQVKTKEVNGETLYAVKPPEGRRMLPLGYFKTEAEAIEATRSYKEANHIEW